MVTTFRFKYMYAMQLEFLKVKKFVDGYFSTIFGYEEETESYLEESKYINTKIKNTLEQMYSDLVARGEITTKWKSEMALFQLVKKVFPDAIYQYYSEWLGQQSLDIYIPSLKVALEYQGIIHYEPVEFLEERLHSNIECI